MDDRFGKVLTEMVELHERKSADYGTDEDPYANVRSGEDFGVPPWLGAAIRGNDKMARLKSFSKNGDLKNESVRDSLVDWAMYGVIAVIMYDDEHGLPKAPRLPEPEVIPQSAVPGWGDVRPTPPPEE